MSSKQVRCFGCGQVKSELDLTRCPECAAAYCPECLTLDAGRCLNCEADIVPARADNLFIWRDSCFVYQCSQCGHLIIVNTDIECQAPSSCPQCGAQSKEATS